MPGEAASIRVVLTTVGSLEESRRMARALVERRLAACVNLVPKLTSIYRWQGAVEEAEEVLLVMKTTEDQLATLEAAVREHMAFQCSPSPASNRRRTTPPKTQWSTRENSC